MAESDAPVGVWTGLLKWSLAQQSLDPSPDAKPLSEEDKKFLKDCFESLVVDEVKRMRIICEVLRMPEDEPGIRRLVQESSNALAKLQEVAPGRSEAEHYGNKSPASPSPAASAAAAASPSPSPARSSPSPPCAPYSLPGPPPTLSDYTNASIPALAAEMLRRKEGALEELDDRCLTSDNANDFMKVGGLEPLLIVMLSRYDALRWRAAQALSTMVQNNPKAQKHAHEHGAMKFLVPLLTPPGAAAPASSLPPTSSPSSASSPAALSDAGEEDPWIVVVKALTALSALCRSDEIPAIRDSFMQEKGFDKIADLFLHPGTSQRVQTKLMLFLRHLLGWYPSLKPVAVARNILPVLLSWIGRSADIGHREACLRCLLEFAKATGDAAAQDAAKELRKKQYGLEATLKARIKTLKALKDKEDKEQAEEELTLATALFKACKF